MKKIILLWLFLSCFIFIWCDQNLWENESFYEWNLVVLWVWPWITFESTVEEWTLVLKWSFEDHSDHIFLSKWVREKYFKEKFDYLPWTTVKFKWVVEFIDWAAGNHYYNVKSIDKLKVKKYPNISEIKEILNKYNYCETDLDCGYFEWICPLDCYIPINIEFIDIATDIVTNFSKHINGEMCVYDCLFMDKAVCNNYKCEMKSNEEFHEFISCSSDEKDIGVCNMKYEPVCGSDSRTYWNSCIACQSETVDSYKKWECENSAFAVEWDSKYLSEIEKILKNDWSVTCDLFYTDFWRQVHALFMADNNRFYSEIDDYSDNYRRNQNYTLVINWKTYYRSTFPDSDNIMEDSSIDIESEIVSMLMDAWKHLDFQMNCSWWIENENLFNVPGWQH